MVDRTVCLGRDCSAASSLQFQRLVHSICTQTSVITHITHGMQGQYSLGSQAASLVQAFALKRPPAWPSPFIRKCEHVSTVGGRGGGAWERVKPSYPISEALNPTQVDLNMVFILKGDRCSGRNCIAICRAVYIKFPPPPWIDGVSLQPFDK
jgi:hypothetical protein